MNKQLALKNHVQLSQSFRPLLSAWISADGHSSISQSDPAGINVPYGGFGTTKFLFDISNGEFSPAVIRSSSL
jgi:hypothetical protein